MTGRSGSESSRSFGSEGTRSSNIRPAIADGQWHSFGNRDVVRTAATSGFVGGARTANFGRSGNFRGGWGGYGWGGRGGWGWGGLGFGFGWPYWGFGWDPWLYSPYWYGPWAYSYYPDYGLDYYGYNWSDDPPPYRPDSYNSKDAPDANLSPNYHLSASSNSNNRELDRN
jgi:hypothetical protein